MDAANPLRHQPACFRKTKESPQCGGAALNRRPRIASWFEQLLKRHVDPMRSDLVQRTPFDTQSLEETA